MCEWERMCRTQVKGRLRNGSTSAKVVRRNTFFCFFFAWFVDNLCHIVPAAVELRVLHATAVSLACVWDQ